MCYERKLRIAVAHILKRQPLLTRDVCMLAVRKAPGEFLAESLSGTLRALGKYKLGKA